MENTPKPTQCNLTHHLDNCEYICQICKKLLCSSCVDEDTCLPGKYHTFQILNLLLKDKSKIYLYDSTSGIISFLLADLKNIKDFETITMDISKDSTVRKFEVYKLENSYFRICVDPNELVERGVLYMVEYTKSKIIQELTSMETGRKDNKITGRSVKKCKDPS